MLDGEWLFNATPRPLYPPGKTRCPLYRRLCGTQGRSERMRKTSPPPGFDPRTASSQQVAIPTELSRGHSQQDVKSQNGLILNAAARTSKPLKILAFIYIMLLYAVQSRALQFSGCNSCFVYSCWVRTWAQRPGHSKAFHSLLPHLQALLPSPSYTIRNPQHSHHQMKYNLCIFLTHGSVHHNSMLTLRLLMSYIYIYIYDISSLMVNDLTLILLTWRKW